MSDSTPDSLTRRFELHDEPALLLPDALGRLWAKSPTAGLFDDDEDSAPYRVTSAGVALIQVIGPLMQYGGWWWDGFASIKAKTARALNDGKVKALVLEINSPGGVVAGCFDTVKALRAEALRVGKPVFTHANEAAYSAGYALATVGSKIYLPPSGGVGSVGVITSLASFARMNERIGLDVAVITSGSCKADGHPELPISKEVRARVQARVDQLAALFFDLVSDARGMAADAVKALEAACFYGRDAVGAGLADGVATLDEVLSMAAQAASQPRPIVSAGQSTGTKPMDETLKQVLALAGTDDPDAALGRLAAWKSSHEKLIAQGESTERELLIAQGEREHKLTPDEARRIRDREGFLGGLNLKQLGAMIAERQPHFGTPPKAPADPKPPTGTPPSQGAEVTLSDAELKFARSAGLDPADVLAQKRRDAQEGR